MPEISEYYRQQRLAEIAGNVPLGGGDIARITQQYREIARVGEVFTQQGVNYLEKAEPAEAEDQFNSAKVTVAQDFESFRQGLASNSDTSTYIPNLEKMQAERRDRILKGVTNQRAKDNVTEYLAVSELDEKGHVFNEKNSLDARNWVNNFNNHRKYWVNSGETISDDRELDKNLINLQQLHGLKMNPETKKLETDPDYTNPLLISDENRLANYNFDKEALTAKYEKAKLERNSDYIVEIATKVGMNDLKTADDFINNSIIAYDIPSNEVPAIKRKVKTNINTEKFLQEQTDIKLKSASKNDTYIKIADGTITSTTQITQAAKDGNWGDEINAAFAFLEKHGKATPEVVRKAQWEMQRLLARFNNGDISPIEAGNEGQKLAINLDVESTKELFGKLNKPPEVQSANSKDVSRFGSDLEKSGDPAYEHLLEAVQKYSDALDEKPNMSEKDRYIKKMELKASYNQKKLALPNRDLNTDEKDAAKKAVATFKDIISKITEYKDNPLTPERESQFEFAITQWLKRNPGATDNQINAASVKLQKLYTQYTDDDIVLLRQSIASGQPLKTWESTSGVPELDIFAESLKTSPAQKADTMPEGMIERGNINLNNQTIHINKDGSSSTLKSESFNIDGVEILLDMVDQNGKLLSDKEAIAQYKKTGKHLGKFSSPKAATKYAQQIHEKQAKMKYTIGQEIFKGGKLWKVVGFNADGRPLVDEVK